MLNVFDFIAYGNALKQLSDRARDLYVASVALKLRALEIGDKSPMPLTSCFFFTDLEQCLYTDVKKDKRLKEMEKDLRELESFSYKFFIDDEVVTEVSLIQGYDLIPNFAIYINHNEDSLEHFIKHCKLDADGISYTP